MPPPAPSAPRHPAVVRDGEDPPQREEVLLCSVSATSIPIWGIGDSFLSFHSLALWLTDFQQKRGLLTLNRLSRWTLSSTPGHQALSNHEGHTQSHHLTSWADCS